MDLHLFRLIYRSRLVAGRDDAVMAIFELSQRENAAQELTGVLFHDDQEIVQVLEGPLAKVEQAYDALSCNLGHGDLQIVEFVPAEDRLFGFRPMVNVAAGDDAGACFLELLRSAGAGLSTASGKQLANFLSRALCKPAAEAA